MIIRTRGRKILRDVWARKGRTALVTLSIMIGVFGAVSMVSGGDLLVKQIKNDVNPKEIAMVGMLVTTSSANAEIDNPAALAALRSHPGVTEAEGMMAAPVFWKKVNDTHFRKSFVLAYSEPFGSIPLEPMRLLKGGRWPEKGEIVIERRMADQYDLKVGDKVNFRVLNPESDYTDATEWTISGIVFNPYMISSFSGDVEPSQSIYASYDDAVDIAGVTGYTTLYLRYTDMETAKADVGALEQLVSRETNYVPRWVWSDDPNDYFMIGQVKQVTNVLNILAVVSLVVSGFLVTNVINTIVVEQKRQIGMIKSVGGSRWDTFVIYAGVALLYGIIGTIPGVIFGMIFGSWMGNTFAPLAYTLVEGFHVSTTGVLLGLIMGLVVPVVASIIPVFNATRVTIREAITDLGISSKWGRSPLARLIRALPLPVNVRQALSNVAQKKGRLLLTVITLMLATTAFMGVFAMFTAVSNEIDKIYESYKFEIIITPTEPQDIATIQDLVKSVGGVVGVDPGVSTGVELFDVGQETHMEGTDGFNADFNISSIGIDPAKPIVDFSYSSGTGWEEDKTRDGVVLSKSAADRFNKKVGDQVVVSSGGQSQVYTVIGISTYPDEVVIMKWQDLARLSGFVSSDNGTPDDFSDDTPLPTLFFVTLENHDLTSKQVIPTIDKISDELLGAGITAEYENEVEVKEEAANRFNTFNLIFQITSGVMAAVGAIGLLATLSMAVYERQKEIGVMRSIGARSSTIMTQFLVEGILIGVIAWILAVPLSYLLAQALINAMDLTDFVTFHYPLWVLGLGLTGMVIVATLASLWPSIAASRKTVSNILRYQ